MMEPLSQADKDKIIRRYTNRFADFGYSQKALGWGDKGKQELRFEVLSSRWDFSGMRVLDVGAGFGDFFRFIGPERIAAYHGVELVPALCGKGNELYGSHPKFRLTQGDFLSMEIGEAFDICIISGLFNFRLTEGDNYVFIRDVIGKAFGMCSVGLAANFITDRVDYHEELIFNSRPEKILSIGLDLTRNLVLRNDYFPFEFSLFLNRDDSFSASDTVFNSWKNGK